MFSLMQVSFASLSVFIHREAPAASFFHGTARAMAGWRVEVHFSNRPAFVAAQRKFWR
jgi:hypothetical protein